MGHRRPQSLLVPGAARGAAVVGTFIAGPPPRPAHRRAHMKLREDEPAPGTLDVEGNGRDGRGPRRPDPRQNRGPDGRRTLATRFREQPVLNTLLVLACVALIILGFEAVGPSSSSSGQATRTATAKDGVVQSTVSGSGNIQSADELNLGFKTSGTVTHIYVKEGQHVTQGQLLATLDPSSAEVTLEQAKASLQSAEANLAKLEETEGETSGSQGSSGTGTAATTASTSSVSYATEAVAYTPTTTDRRATGTGTSTSTTPATTTAPTTTTTPSASPKKSRQKLLRRGPGLGVHPLDAELAGHGSHHHLDPGELDHHQTERRHPRSQPRLGQSGRQERQALGAERRTGRREHEAVRPGERDGRDAVGRSRRNRLRDRHQQSLLQLQQLVDRLLLDRCRRDRQRLDRLPAPPPPPPPAPAPAARAPPRSPSSATSNRCRWSCR